MQRSLTKKEVDILEERGLWRASSSLHKVIKRLIRKNLPLEIRYILQAHRTIFTTAHQSIIAGKYRRDNGPELKRIDGTPLLITDWMQVPSAMAELNDRVVTLTKNLHYPKTKGEYSRLVSGAVQLSHRLACIHPFVNGNGRSSRLLLSAILLRAGLPEIAVKKSKPAYLRAMRQADDGDFSLLERVVIKGLIENNREKFEAQRRKQAELARRR